MTGLAGPDPGSRITVTVVAVVDVSHESKYFEIAASKASINL